jgi:Crinkler effector protein N-terminal domain
VLGDWKKGFTVEIPKTKNVSILKDPIKEKKSPHLNHLAASDLELFQVSIPHGDDAEERFKKDDRQPLNYLSLVSELFPVVKGNHLHIIVEVPANGELFRSFQCPRLTFF